MSSSPRRPYRAIPSLLLLCLSILGTSSCGLLRDIFLGSLYELHIDQTGLGTVRVEADSPNEAIEPGRYAYRAGTTVTLKATPDYGYAFDSWGGDRRDSYDPETSLFINRTSWLKPSFVSMSDPWLVMVYMAGANDLEREALMDLNAMEAGLARAAPELRANLRVVALVDRMAGYSDDDGDWTGSRLYELRPDTNPLRLASAIIPSASVGGQVWRSGSDDEMRMGKASTLASFVSWAMESYPEHQRRALIFWNHGSGVFSSRSVSSQSLASQGLSPGSTSSRSICYDDEDLIEKYYGLDGQLFIGELSDTLGPILSGHPLELIGFDACHMGLYEIAYELRGVARYFAGSPTSVKGGWAYKELFSSTLAFSNGAVLAREASRLYATTPFGASLTAFDLAYISTVRTALDALATDLKNLKPQAEAARDSAWLYASPDVPAENIFNSLQFPYRDLAHLCGRLVEQEGLDDAVTSKAETVLEALEAGTLWSWSKHAGAEYSEGRNAYGLGILFPPSDVNYKNDHTRYYTDADAGAAYGRLDAAAPGDTWRGMLDALYP